jgi:hypothetical protein
MAVLNSIFSWASGDATVLSVNATSASTAQAIGHNQLFQIIGSGAFNLRFDVPGTNIAGANSMQIPANTLVTLNAGQCPYFSVYNPGGSTISVRYIVVSRS